MKNIILLAILLPMTSFQTWSILSNHLVVHVTNDPMSSICYQGKAEDYDGKCVSPAAPTQQYLIKQEELRKSK